MQSGKGIERKYSMLKIDILHEAGYNMAMASLQYTHTNEEFSMSELADHAAQDVDASHAFMDHMIVWAHLKAPLYFLQQASVATSRAYLMSVANETDEYSDELALITEKTPKIIEKFRMWELLVSFSYLELRRWLHNPSICTNMNVKRVYMQLLRQLKYPDFILGGYDGSLLKKADGLPAPDVLSGVA